MQLSRDDGTPPPASGVGSVFGASLAQRRCAADSHACPAAVAPVTAAPHRRWRDARAADACPHGAAPEAWGRCRPQALTAESCSTRCWRRGCGSRVGVLDLYDYTEGYAQLVAASCPDLPDITGVAEELGVKLAWRQSQAPPLESRDPPPGPYPQRWTDPTAAARPRGRRDAGQLRTARHRPTAVGTHPTVRGRGVRPLPADGERVVPAAADHAVDVRRLVREPRTPADDRCSADLRPDRGVRPRRRGQQPHGCELPVAAARHRRQGQPRREGTDRVGDGRPPGRQAASHPA